MNCVKLLGQGLMARDFDRQVAELQVRIAVLNRYTALGIPVTEPVGQIRLGKGEVRSGPDLCNRAIRRKPYRQSLIPDRGGVAYIPVRKLGRKKSKGPQNDQIEKLQQP